MKKADLKRLIKPVVKECIHEVLLEEGLLSNVVAEVAKGMQGNLVVESAPVRSNTNTSMAHQSNDSREKIREHRRQLMDSIGKDAYNGVNLFEGTEPASGNPKQGSTDLGHPRDAGVDISSILGNSSQIWKAIK
tara:strand:+ start:1112 stop:1513 length:402 start_codon:yes stop_codon:yes gene_type:complete